MTKSAADVEAEVEASRSSLDRTMEALKDKMTPGQMFDEASKMMGATGQQVFSKFMEQARENPMPLAVMGLGLAWLMSTSRNGDAPRYRAPEPRAFASGGRGGVMAAAHDAGDKAAELMSGAKDRLADAGAAIADTRRSAVDGLGSAAHSAMETAGDYRDRAQRGLTHLLESEPLLVGAVGFVVGAAIGASLPHTDIEDRAVGPLRDKVLEKGKALADDTLHRASEVTQAVYSGIKDELANPDPAGSGLADRAEAVARSGVQAARDEIEGRAT